MAALAAVLLLAALAVPARLAWRQRQQGRLGGGRQSPSAHWRQEQQQGDISLQPLVARERRARESGSSANGAEAVPLGRRRRLDATLKSRRCHHIRMLPEDALPLDVAHQLGANGDSSRLLLRPPTSGTSDARLRSALHDRSSGSGSPEWDLPTDSLRLDSGELEVRPLHLLWPSVCAADLPCLRRASALRAVCTLPRACAPPTLLLRSCTPPLPSAQFIADESGELRILGRGQHAIVYAGVLIGHPVAVKVRGGSGAAGLQCACLVCASPPASSPLCTPPHPGILPGV